MLHIYHTVRVCKLKKIIFQQIGHNAISLPLLRHICFWTLYPRKHGHRQKVVKKIHYPYKCSKMATLLSCLLKLANTKSPHLGTSCRLQSRDYVLFSTAGSWQGFCKELFTSGEKIIACIKWTQGNMYLFV